MGRPTVVSLVLLGVIFVGGVAAAPPDRVDRLVPLAKLWATVKYFHPAIDESRPSVWDEALLAAVPAVDAAISRAEYAAALNAMLARLQDSATRVEDDVPDPNALASGFVRTEWRNDVLLVTGGPALADPLESLQGVVKELARAEAVIFDLRQGPVHPWLWQRHLVPTTSSPLPLPGHRFRVHVGNVTPRGAQDAPFFSGHLTRSAPASLGAQGGGQHRRVVFLVNESQQLPLLAVALQVAGTGYIISESPIDDRAIGRHGMIQHHRLSVGEELVAHIRTSMMVHGDGTTGVRADRVVAADALEVAFQAAAGRVAHARRPPAPPQYEERAPESPYAESPYPSWPLRVLAATRVWATFEWLYPYRDLIEGSWEGELRNALVLLREAKNAEAYHLAIARMVARVGDTHAAVNSPTLQQFWGAAAPALRLRPVEGKPVVVALTDPTAMGTGAAVGDVLLAVDGVPVEQRLAVLRRHISASTPQALERDATAALLRGTDASTADLIVGRADGSEGRIRLPRRSEFLHSVWKIDDTASFRVLPSGFGYIDLRLLMPHQVDAAFDALQDTDGLIFDMRGYPNGTMTVVARRLTDKLIVFRPRLWLPLLFEPEAVTRHEFRPPSRIVPRGVPYRARTVMLIDDRAQSQSEATASLLRAVHGTVFIGTPTAGANGEGSNFTVPGGLSIGMTGVGVSHPDGRQLQRVGVLPDFAVQPTINGIRAGRDEVLERAVRYLEELTNQRQ
jgi:C-terminal processing protease CtpA/Prc